MIEIHLRTCTLQVGSDGVHKIMMITDAQSGIKVVVPIDTIAAVQIGRALAGGSTPELVKG